MDDMPYECANAGNCMSRRELEDLVDTSETSEQRLAPRINLIPRGGFRPAGRAGQIVVAYGAGAAQPPLRSSLSGRGRPAQRHTHTAASKRRAASNGHNRAKIACQNH